MQWYYSKDGVQLGPVSDSEIRGKFASGEILVTDLVWREGMRDWQPAAKVPELASQSSLNPSAPSIPSVPGGVVNSPYSSPVHGGGAYPGGAVVPPTSGLAIASMICGILGLVTCLLLPGIPAVICGHMALSQMAAPGARIGGRGMAIAGLVTGYVSVILGLGGIVLFAIGALASASH
jgi:GYF domain 2/Domain of unknown function (DUF4190)